MIEELMGSQEPSARIVPDYCDSDGADACRLLRAGGLRPDLWQEKALNDWMALNSSKKWAAPTCGGSVPRQNGKSLLVQGRAEAGMLLYNEQVIYTAHLQKTATETFEEMRDFFESGPIKKYVSDIKAAIGREQIILKTGARIKFLARTRNGGRGQHGDLLIFDEAQELTSEQQASFLPAISASLNPQTVYVGTPPDENADGTVFRGIREKALANETTNTAWFEFSVPEIGDIRDKARWAKANPALGARILLSTIEGECEQMDPDTFARERLGWWSPVNNSEDYAIDKAQWDACASEEPKPAQGKVAFGVKFSPDGAEVSLCGAICPQDGPARISLIERRSTSSGVQWLADWLNQRYSTACCVVIDGRNGVDFLIDKLKDTWRFKGSIIKPGSKDVIAAASQLTQEIGEQTVTWYKLQPMLSESATTSIKRAIGGGWGFGGENSTPIEAAALALWGCRQSKRDPSRKMRIG